MMENKQYEKAIRHHKSVLYLLETVPSESVTAVLLWTYYDVYRLIQRTYVTEEDIEIISRAALSCLEAERSSNE